MMLSCCCPQIGSIRVLKAVNEMKGKKDQDLDTVACSKGCQRLLVGKSQVATHRRMPSNSPCRLRVRCGEQLWRRSEPRGTHRRLVCLLALQLVRWRTRAENVTSRLL